MEPVSTSALVLAALHAVKTGMDLLPDYEQKEIKKYEKYLELYQMQLELPLDDDDRDDDLLLNLKSRLFIHVEKYKAFIQRESKKS